MIRWLIFFILFVFVISSAVHAETYSGFDRFIDDVTLFFSYGDSKVMLAMELREKEVNSAIENSKNENINEATASLERAEGKLAIVQEKISLKTSAEVKTNTENMINKIKSEELSEEFDNYIKQEEKTMLTAELTEKTYELCMELANEDYNSMLQDERCNPSTAPEWLQDELKNLKNIQNVGFNALMLDIRSCIDDPGTCDCENNLVPAQKMKCEKMVALAVKCEYKDDENACQELKSMNPTEGDGFAESFIPDFLMNLFVQKESKMIDYNIEKSDVPAECYNENERVKTECAQYRIYKELSDKCWDSDGNFLVDQCGGPEDREPTMEESIPQCFENGVFLEEKCGKVTVTRNEEGLINYLIESELNNIIDMFENSSMHIDMNRTIDINGTKGRTVIEIKEEMKVITEDIAERTFAPGTWDTGNASSDVQNTVVEGGKNVAGDNGLVNEVVTGTSGGDDGLMTEVVTGVAEGGDNGLTPEVITGGSENNVVEGGVVTPETPAQSEPVNTIDPGTIDESGTDGGMGPNGEWVIDP